ncbi:DNA primase [Ornithinimicrobium pratense]|uniref:DNA primase n=1 Tax=Ornithinimicrobium pratense TaxID=2593973 RepID=UPI001EE15BB8|nr:DNA primase [Ornithinimicrobium pratense]
MRRINDEDKQALKDKASIEDVVREHVTLRNAGVGALKGLCPFHDEKTPSFNVRPALGTYHCFGCEEGGDVIDFMMKIDHLTFAEAVERLAEKVGFTLRYEEVGGPGGRSDQPPVGQRTRLMEAHRVAEEFYHEALVRSAEGRKGRDFLRDKGFNGAHATQFMVGYAPRAGTALVDHLRLKGFTEEELVLGGLANRRGRGLSDRFQGRVLWPIRAITGDTVGFGARRLYEDDWSPAKYLNTSETPIYKKTGVLYGLDLAKKAIAAERTAVVVEGYTDVMAAHLAGVGTAVATCGTAFGSDHITILRRILRDEAGRAPARVIFTFDGDAAGQKAAMRAFEQDQRWAAQSYVAVAADGADPNDLWVAGVGDTDEEKGRGVRELVEAAQPMFEFAVRTTLAPYDLGEAAQRVQAMRAVAPILAQIKDQTLRPEVTRDVAGWMGIDPASLTAEVHKAARVPQRGSGPSSRPGPAPGQGQPSDTPGRPAPEGPGQAGAPGAPPQSGPPPLPRPDLRDPVQMAERHLLQVALQYPLAIVPEDVDELEPAGFRAPMHRAVWHAVRTAGGVPAASAMSAAAWVQAVLRHTPRACTRWCTSWPWPQCPPSGTRRRASRRRSSSTPWSCGSGSRASSSRSPSG